MVPLIEKRRNLKIGLDGRLFGRVLI